jgi:hypothetical protein
MQVDPAALPRTLPDPAATARALALAICEVEAGLRSAGQLERICHRSLWAAVANRIQRAGGPPVSAASVLPPPPFKSSRRPNNHSTAAGAH